MFFPSPLEDISWGTKNVMEGNAEFELEESSGRPMLK